MTRKSENVWGPAATFAVVATLMGSIFWLKGPLESQRPQDQAEFVGSELSLDPAPARLWQDPLHAIQRHLNHRDSNPSRSLTSLDLGIPLDEMQNGNCQRQLQLLVMMPGGPYAEDREDRRRQRHAVVSALTEHHYVPENAEQIRIGYVRNDFSDSSSSDVGTAQRDSPENLARPRSTTLVGFETYKPGLEFNRENGTNDWESILLVWLNDKDFNTDLHDLILKLKTFLDKSGWCKDHDQVTVLLGPVSSEALLRMPSSQQDPAKLPKESSNNTKQINKHLKRLRILSPRATVPLEWLFRDLSDSTAGSSQTTDNVNESFRRKLGVKSYGSVVATDDQIQRAILKELKDRGLFNKGLPLIAIVSEQDSSYGRLLDDILKQVICEFLPKTQQKIEINGIVREYGYLRGVDGELPPTTSRSTNGLRRPNQVEADPDLKIESSLMSTAHPEHSFGVSQVDYIRRLADRIAYDLSDNIRKKGENAYTGNANDPVVVGILGSDVYDKLLILQALRERLPSATFFTTDLDARLTDPDVYAWSRNLIIGSPYGFTVRDLKGAGFRGSYQTALYRAVTLALNEHYNEEPPPPRLFEIGRTGPIDITRIDGDCGKSSYTSVHGSVSYIRSRPTEIRHLGSVLLVLLPLIALTIFAIARSNTLHSKRRELRRRAHCRVSRIGVSLLISLIPTMWIWKRIGYEPWPFFEGVNSQPAIILYLTTVVFAWGIILIMLGRINQGNREIHNEFGLLSPAMISKWSLRKLCNNLWHKKRYLGPWIYIWRHNISGVQQKNRRVQICWNRYLRYSDLHVSLVRILVRFSVIFFLVSMYIWYWPGLSGPLLTRDVYAILDLARWLAVLAVVFTVLFCSDTLNVGHAMLREISCYHLVGWPKAARPDDYCSRLKLKMDLLVHFTECLRPIAVLPFILMFLLILARSTVLEGWVWTPKVVGFYAVLSLFVLTRAVRFQFEAVRAKDSILSSLDEWRHKNWNQPNVLSRIEITRGTINGINKGAFVPWTRQPILQSLLLPVGAYGVVILVDTIF